MTKNFCISSETGFSLTSVLVTMGLLGMVSLGVMQVSKNIGDVQTSASSKSDELELNNSIRLLLNEERFCRVSLAGNGPKGTPTTPVVFQKSNIDQDTEGLDVALFLSDQAGVNRSLKKFNGANNPAGNDKSQVHGIKITSLKLIMNNGTGSNYADSPLHSDIGIIRMMGQKRISSTKTRDFKVDFDVRMDLSTTGGNTTILGCSGTGMEAAMAAYMGTCKVCFACSDDTNWNNFSACDTFNNNGWTSSTNKDFCADDGRIAVKVVCGTDTYSDVTPNVAP